MFLAKVKIVAGVILVAATLAAGGIAYRVENVQAAPPEPAKADRPPSELEALRKENELLRLNLQVVLEKVRAQEEELRTLRARGVEKKQEKKLEPPPVGVEETHIDPRDAGKYLRRWRQHLESEDQLSFRCRLTSTEHVFQTTTKLQGSFRASGPGSFLLELHDGDDTRGALRLLGTKEGIYQSIAPEGAKVGGPLRSPRLLPLLRLVANPSASGHAYTLVLAHMDAHYIYLAISPGGKPTREQWHGRLVLDRKNGLPRQVWMRTDEGGEITLDLLDAKTEGKADPKELTVPEGRWSKVLEP